ncbi:MAG: flagellin N-methylase family protein, partial [Proteobacteria bacterium]|nr:flagellin N-methylase family protein [Pseudomonadota bacterium]
LFGTTPRLACPNGKRPEAMIDPRIEQRIERYFAATRQVLV